jgi:hypothetical protein
MAYRLIGPWWPYLDAPLRFASPQYLHFQAFITPTKPSNYLKRLTDLRSATERGLGNLKSGRDRLFSRDYFQKFSR